MEAEEALAVAVVAAAFLAAATLAAATLAAALALRQPFTVAALEQRQLSEVHTLPAEVSADQLPRLDPTIAALECQL
jgi:hypothetical protein